MGSVPLKDVSVSLVISWEKGSLKETDCERSQDEDEIAKSGGILL